ncbi:hypothetical protein [Amycolatopsis tolypomycina]|uniref:hypothetical protein n=1 Tax=Amycolatopsis tolypomycina TaxID=208445 RepID=UPI0033B13D19
MRNDDADPVLARRTALAVLGAGPGSGGTELGVAGDIPVGGGKVFADKQVVVTQPAGRRRSPWTGSRSRSPAARSHWRR